MTPERQNEIWAMLTQKTKDQIQRIFLKESLAKVDSYGHGYKDALIDIFGSHNLTAQAEENRTIPTENGISDSKIQSESAESVETRAKKDAYFAYRLDLAKELAVAMINTPNCYGNIAKTTVDTANEIVKRLKETEE